jgi:hypothetical protein
VSTLENQQNWRNPNPNSHHKNLHRESMGQKHQWKWIEFLAVQLELEIPEKLKKNYSNPLKPRESVISMIISKYLIAIYITNF